MPDLKNVSDVGNVKFFVSSNLNWNSILWDFVALLNIDSDFDLRPYWNL